ncbi:MAG: MSMEG_6728 family protein [Actinomycetota bacterium]|nr:MSMEG_6728 family protein [Actinomycetota bacterium]
MQTFLPFADFEQCARALDSKRLGKQRVEVIQILRALTWPGYGWAHHPAVLMWKQHEEALVRYGLTCCDVWTELGFADTCAATMRADLGAIGIEHVRPQAELADTGALPVWLGNDDLHRSHRAALLRKDPDWYRPRFPGVPEDLPYFWPVRSEKAVQAELRRAESAVRRQQRTAAREAKDVVP